MDYKLLSNVSYNSKYLSVRNTILLTILLIFIIICFYIQRHSIQCEDLGALNDTACGTGNGCQLSYLKSDGTCETFNKPNGIPCENDICFNHSLCTPTCDLCTNGGCNAPPDCVGPRSCCLGLCNVASDCAANVPFVTDSFTYFCLYDENGFNGTCYYQLFTTMTNDPSVCLGLVDGPLANCMYAVTSDTVEWNGYCFYYWKCAPPYSGFGIPN